nr:D(1)-like dopamine receptor [Lytechinus pictus]
MESAKTTLHTATRISSTLSTKKTEILGNDTDIQLTVETYMTSGISGSLGIHPSMVNGTSNDSSPYADDFGTFTKPPWHLGIISIIYGILIIITVVGNIFVMVAYHRDPRIRRSVANTFILNLAIADFIVGAFTLPVYFGWNLVGVWIFGEYLCKVWSFVDFTVTAMSVITIILISLDRYWLLSKKAAYASFQTQRRVDTTIGICWSVVSAIFLVLIFAWSAIVGQFNVDFSNFCESEFVFNLSALICVVITNFAIPALIIAILNIQVYRMIRERARGIDALDKTIQRESGVKITSGRTTFLLRALRKKQVPPVAGIETKTKKRDPAVILVTVTNRKASECHHNPAYEQQSDVATSSLSNGGASASSIAIDENNVCATNDDQSGERENMNVDESIPQTPELKQNVFSVCKGEQRKHESPKATASSNLEGMKTKLKKKQREFKRERKAAFILAVLVSVFIFCWLPYNITVVIGISCSYECIPETVFIVVENLVWINSALNPLLYAFTNVHFRRNFLTFLGFGRMARKLEGPHSIA